MAIINRTTKKIRQIEVFGFGDQKLVIENIWLPSSSIRKLGDWKFLVAFNHYN